MSKKAAMGYGAALFLGLSIGGCSESPDAHPTMLHKPGVYKGAIDPLIEKQRTPQQQEMLQARFNQIQTDR